MEKQLYRVKVLLFVMAENESEACMAATQAHFDIFECAARKAENIPPEWIDAFPYNADDDRTCSEIMNNQRQTNRLETHRNKLPPYAETAIRVFNPGNQSIQLWQRA